MDEVEDLLKAWELEELLSTFRSNAVTIQALASLSSEEIKELIPQIGPRALFMRCWKTWMLDFTKTSDELNYISTSDITLSDIELLPIIQSQEEETSQQKPQLNHHKDTEYVIVESDCSASNSILIKLLKENLEASSLLARVGGSLQGDPARNLLASIIAKEILKNHQGLQITNTVYNRWCAEIKKNFPKERITTYYIPPCITASGTTHQARGKLVSQVLNTRRKYQKLGVLTTKKKRTREDVDARLASTSTSRINIESDDSAADDEERIEEEIQWLKNSSDPWSMVEQKWKVTVNYRLLQLKNMSIEQYLAEYPALKKPHGIALLHSDFDAANPAVADNLQLNFPIIKPKLLQMLQNKKIKEPFYEELVKLADSPIEEDTNIAAFMALPHLIPTNVISSSKKKKTEKEKKWKPTKIETRDSFISHIRDDSYLRLTIDKRHSSYTERGLTLQPYIVMVGPTLSDIKSYFVVLNTDVFYSRTNIMSAVDSCFKSIWALNLEYSAECYGVWYFIQKGFFKLTSTYDKGSTSAESLLTDCM